MSRWLAILALVVALGSTAPVVAQSATDPPASDLLNAVLWMQRSVEYKASALTAFALARIRLDQALADPNWTGAPKTWNAYVNTVTSLPIPGALEFAQYADSKGVKVFYVTNRTAEEEPATRKNLEKFGFPMGGNADTKLMTRKQPEWGSAKGTRRAHVARNYRVLLNVGDNFGDFVDEFRGNEAERLKVLEQHKDRWGREWIMIANPSYGSFESASFGHDFKLPEGEKRKLKRGALDAWPGP